ncbi:hypothetical protein HII13_001040 [Brettanomyces bruxellensis]|mgnify:FL=1|nr:hypothetical protein HII13_001040 [Brettanomyces bruxellensis]
MSLSISPFKVKAVYSWGGQDRSKDLGFIEGDIIEVLRVGQNGHIYYGKSLRTKLFGNFPSKYAKVLHIQESPSSHSLNGLKNSARLDNEAYSRMNASTPSLHTIKASYYDSLRSDSQLSSPENSEIFSLNHQSYSYSDYEDQKVKSNTKTDEEVLSQLPPVPPKHRVKASCSSLDSSASLSLGKEARSSYVQQLLNSTSSADTNSSSAFGYSDLSATSAGSYTRHKNQRNSSIIDQNKNKNVAKLFDETENENHAGFFKKLLGRDKNHKPSLDEKIFRSSQEQLTDRGMETSSIPMNLSKDLELREQKLNRKKLDHELDRVKSLSGRERARRKSRALQEEPGLILQPHRFLSNVNKNELISEVKHNFSLDSTPLAHVDRYIDEIPPERCIDLDAMVHRRIEIHFKTRLERTRAVYTFLATKFQLVESPDEKLSTKVMPGADSLKEILFSRKCTAHQLTWLFFLMASALGIDTEIILGHFKKPFEYDDPSSSTRRGLLTLNHSWVSVLLEGEFRLIDVALGNPTNTVVANDLSLNSGSILEEYFDFYFLAKPLELIYTHVPLHVDCQHVVPPLDPLAQLALPPLYPSFLQSGLRLYKFNQAMFRLQDLEVINFDLEIPSDFEIKAMVQPLDEDNYSAEKSFVQVYWKSGRRLAKIKTVLPPNCSIGFLTCYGRASVNESDIQDKGHYSLKTFRDNYSNFSLLVSIPCFHKGKFNEVDWCRINPLPVSISLHDIYIKEPQTYNLLLGRSYTFNIKVYSRAEGQISEEFRCMLIAPSGEFSEFQKIVDEVWEVRKTLRECGEWRLVVPNENTGKWHVYSKWYCE